MADSTDRVDVLQVTLELMILRVLRWGPRHGHGIATAIRQSSNDDIRVEGGSLYPALQRLLRDDLIEATWGVSSNNRRARFYTLTRAGRRRLVEQETTWSRLVRAMQLIGKKPLPE